MIHRLFATHNRRVIIALLVVAMILSVLGYLILNIRQATIARLQLNQNLPNDLTRVTASASTDVQVILESNITSLAASEREVPVKIMVSKPENTVLSALAVDLKYDTAKFDPPTITADASCNVMTWVTPTPSTAPANTSPFAPRVHYATGASPRSVSASDFNGDSKPDLAVLNAASHTISILLNTGNGTFASKVDYNTGSYPFSITSGDLNGDNKPDLAVTDWITNTVSVLMNTGNGTFASKVDYGAGTYPYSVTMGDFNSDGKLDLAVANSGSNTVSVLMNTGNGTFAAKADYATATQPYSLIAGDLNGDNKPDLAVASATDAVSVLMNTGNGTFAAKADYATDTNSNSHSITTSDFNSDGKLDLAVANSGSNTVSVLMNTGNGTFAAKVSYATGTEPESLSSGDLNGDNKPDLAVTNIGTNSVSVLINTGTGAFLPKVDYSTEAYPFSIVARDLNGDGKPDLAVTDFGSISGSVSIFINTTVAGAVQVGAHTGDETKLTLVGAGVLDANASSQMVTAVQKTSGDTQPGTANFCLAKAIFKIKSDFTSGTGRIEVVASGGDTRIETVPLTGTTMGIIEGQQYVEVTKADPGYTIASPAYDLRMTGTVVLTIKKSVEQIKRGDDFYIDIMAKPTVPEGAFVGMSALEFDFGYGAAIGTDGVPTSKVFVTKFDTSSSSECSVLEHVLPSVTDGYTVVSQRPSIRYSKAGYANFPTTEFCVGRIYMKAMETGPVQMIIKTGDGVALDARGRKMVIQSTNGIAQSISFNIESNTLVDPSCEALKLNVDTEDQQTYVRPQQAVVISMNTGLAYKILADKGTGITLKNPPKKFTYTAPATEGPDRIQIWRTDNTYCEPEIAVQSNANGSVSLLDGVFIDPNKVSVRMKIRPQGVIKGRLPYTKLKVAIAAGGLPTNNNLIDPVSNEFVSIGDGMFEGVITFDPRYIKPGKGYKLIIKGSKHLAKRICEPEPNKSKTKPDSAYTCPKDNAGVFEFKNGLNGPYDFSQVFLPAGDLFIDRQDGVIDSTDLTFIRKNLGSQDPEKLRIGDINMDGQIDTQDYLITISNVVNNLDEN